MYIDLKKNPFFLSDKDIAWVQEQLAAMTEQEKIAQKPEEKAGGWVQIK